ncbi:unnamed protein product [Spirodela intermedia]|uniref:Uncharacterized protein n=1 Tax=Spirodela intermedia TaxID=51605 RepID=A0A7I8KC26_SPIIN|nr:unnamed protein product [Spirodela intermedia]
MLEKILEREREDLQKEREDNRKEKQRRQNMGTIIVGTLRHVKQFDLTVGTTILRMALTVRDEAIQPVSIFFLLLGWIGQQLR